MTARTVEEAGPEVDRRLGEVSGKCVECGLCVKECRFLEFYGTPKAIADAFDAGDPNSLAMPFDCSLCGLCAAVCPFDVHPEALFLELRREAVARGAAPMPEHKGLLSYEKAGISSFLTLRALPKGCRTVFFPGCALPGTRPGIVEWVYAKLRESEPSTGIVLDCCTKPSRDLGREQFFAEKFGELKAYLLAQNVKRVLVACPNCLRIFREYAPELQTSTVYEELAALPCGEVKTLSEVTIHDPCVLRDYPEVQEAVRTLAARSGMVVTERVHTRKKTLCCGEGGCVAAVAPDFAQAWGDRAAAEAGGRRVVTYCAGCANFLGSRLEVAHVLDALADPEVAAGGKAKVGSGLRTYLNRWRLKGRLKRAAGGDAVGRAANPLGMAKNVLKALLPLLLLALIVAGVRAAGVGEYLEEERLRGLIAGYGPLAPALYMALYTVAPALFLPGLPITVVGGVLFGPFWGVVYTITSATAGACVAFLVSRYAARGFVEKRLVGSRWKKLDDDVAENGWKVVAFTRLVPLFPFNLLNYALGLTRIGFWPYAVTTFLCMLPACIAFIVFSSSLLDLVNGKVSPVLVLGVLLIVAVSMIPLWLRKRKAKISRAGGVRRREKSWSLAASLKTKAKLAALAAAGWYAWGWLSVKYEFALSGYLNVWEFTSAFVANRFADGNWELFAEFLRTAAPVKAIFALAAAWLTHAVTSPFGEAQFVGAAVAGKGGAAGVALAAAGLFCAAFLLYLPARFLLSDLLPFARSKLAKTTDWKLPPPLSLLAALFAALPMVPLVAGLAVFGGSRLETGRVALLLLAGCLARTLLILLL